MLIYAQDICERIAERPLIDSSLGRRTDKNQKSNKIH